MILSNKHMNKNIKWYACGPTIYDSAHLGHARTFITFDTIRRVLNYFGHNVFYVMNITDIDDKIINKVNADNEMDYFDFIGKMEKAFWDDMDKLNVKPPNMITRVSDYIDKIIEYITKIMENGYAYQSNGSVYMDVQKMVEDGYSKMNDGITNFSTSEFLSEKKNKMDFALWKNGKDGEIQFASPWGSGRPGWHIECTVMASDILGYGFDIHSGGIDLKFPHHHNEILQAKAYSQNRDTPWAETFLHSGHLHIDGEKMSKSLKNAISISGFLNNVGTARELRLLFLSHNWDKPMDYNDNTLKEVKWMDKKITEFLNHAKFILNQKPKYSTHTIDSFICIKADIRAHLLNNFNSPKVITNILKLINASYAYLETTYSTAIIGDVYNYIIEIMTILGLEYKTEIISDNRDIINLIIEFRQDIRDVLKKNNNIKKELYTLVDDLRDNKLTNLGIKVQDYNGKSAKWTKFE